MDQNAIFVTISIFLDKRFIFQPDVCNGCYDLTMMSMYLGDIAALNIKGADYRCIAELPKVKP